MQEIKYPCRYVPAKYSAGGNMDEVQYARGKVNRMSTEKTGLIWRPGVTWNMD